MDIFDLQGDIFPNKNGVQALKNGEHTGATASRFLKGPGYKKS